MIAKDRILLAFQVMAMNNIRPMPRESAWKTVQSPNPPCPVGVYAGRQACVKFAFPRPAGRLSAWLALEVKMILVKEEVFMAITLTVPPRIVQSDPMSCWGASYESWARAVGVSRPPSDMQLYQFFSQISGYTGSNHGATNGGIRAVGYLGGMNLEFVRGSQLTPGFIETRLRQNGHIYLAYRPLAPGIPGGHVVVVYGVADSHVLVMDPDPSVLFPCHAPISWFLSKTHAFVGTSLIGNPRNIANPFAGMQTR